eukprot:266622-Rhodomonas_salina.1
MALRAARYCRGVWPYAMRAYAPTHCAVLTWRTGLAAQPNSNGLNGLVLPQPAPPPEVPSVAQHRSDKSFPKVVCPAFAALRRARQPLSAF